MVVFQWGRMVRRLARRGFELVQERVVVLVLALSPNGGVRFLTGVFLDEDNELTTDMFDSNRQSKSGTRTVS